MEITDIINDAVRYPLDHLKELGIYIGIIFVICIILLLTVGAAVVGINADAIAAAGIVGVIGIVIALLIGLLVNGYGLDIVKLGIELSDDVPSFDITRQIINGFKYLIMAFVYMIIPAIIMILLAMVNQTLGIVVGVILFIIFGLALFMGACRLAETESLGYALNIKDAINDIVRVGVIKVLAVIIIVAIIAAILSFIAGLFADFGTIGAIISAILSALVSAYTFFFQNRAIGLLYSDA